MAKKNNANYISRKESARISRENRRITNAIEKERNRKNVDPSEYLTTMKDPGNVVEFDNLHTYFFTDIGTVKAVDGVTFSVPKGKTVGVVGESGCGKSVTSLSLMQLVQRPQGQVVEGEIRFDAGDKVYNIAKTPTKIMQSIRGSKISMIFQEPMTSLNPVFRIGDQLNEVLELHYPDWDEARRKARSIEMLGMVGIANSEGVYMMYPHELSGGMRQRVMIAMALACNPKLIIADEPTTALDVTIQAQILDLLRKLKDQINSSIMLITHDLGVIAEMADYVVVMYAGRIVEKGTAAEVFHDEQARFGVVEKDLGRGDADAGKEFRQAGVEDVFGLGIVVNTGDRGRSGESDAEKSPGAAAFFDFGVRIGKDNFGEDRRR